MPAYQFTAIDASGKQQKGVLEGDSARQIRQQLRDQSLIPVAVDPIEQKDKHAQQRWFQKGLNAYDLALLTRQLSVLVAAAIPLEEAIRAVGKQNEKAHVQNLLMSVRSKVLEGHSLANALQQAGRFPELYIATIAAGERSGHLDLILDQLADYTENRFAMQKKVQGAMIYPIILMLMSFGIVMGLMTYVVPDIVKTFDQSKDALPWITVALMKASDFIRMAWPFLLVGSVVSIFLLVRFLRTAAGHYAFDRLTLKLPLFSKLSKGINAARFASTLSILTKSGVPLVDALKIGAAVSNNWVIRDSVNLAAEKVTEGGNLATQLERSGYFPPMMVQMIKSGESSGELDRMLERASTMQDREVTTLISTLLALLEPLMLVFMASIVLVIVIAVMLPIVNMNNMI
ncbi:MULTISPECIES: type II secretion system inner membrane protein GspF [Acinetobacter]|jgi:general secretion pathway protein F|uniref:General secretion pathway protein F n=1 Tax=Acinetobacter amyesii TaxID=2942470 RepID=A0A1T1H481_9GAMM|nr:MULTISPECIES: type II secretion system inner membrane protein GspF [Acinetobacter]MCL6237657.1 type II secretion system inner membrane protein GspF [Acinetobacter amyesii]MCL6244483.1 type II secretion system inner membrane protein GspF [Acinetobacter amyesii]MCL6247393.1 type II secretion system inner membrane protein GspF [Acinetobacter amyesii]OOV83290.1 type II secretion system protein GspF [Acinetobacter sp. ANC 5600]OOV84636.1 type II secretion system protein GspF [Acinetobacter amyes